MKRAKILFLLFIFVFSIFQQRPEAHAQDMSNMGNLSSNQAPHAGGLPSKAVVYMYEFTLDGEPTTNPCYINDHSLGCVETLTTLPTPLPYPPDSPYVTPKIPGTVNPLEVDIESYYLKNVLPREMNVAENYPTLAALKAQALAARSISDWKTKVAIARGELFDNTTSYQAELTNSLQ